MRHYDTGPLADGETSKSRFVQIQAAYELLLDPDERKKYDGDHRANPMQVSGTKDHRLLIIPHSIVGPSN